MAGTGELNWVAIGSYKAVRSKIAMSAARKEDAIVRQIVNAVTDPGLEEKIREIICEASPGIHEETWRYLETFKRENRHVCVLKGAYSYWGMVGEKRLPFTPEEFFKEYPRKRTLGKDGESILMTNRGIVVTLLMDTVGKASLMEAYRIAYAQTGLTDMSAWTREYG